MCWRSKIREFPDSGFPASLVMVDCSRNELTHLPVLPAGLKYLNCSHNRITRLPELPKSMTKLVCHFNELTELPKIPESLIVLNFAANPIQRYPYLTHTANADKSIHIVISNRNPYFQTLATQTSSIVNGYKLFSLPFENKDDFISDEDIDEMYYVCYRFEHCMITSQDKILDAVLDIQHQADTHTFVRNIKEELMAATWHPRRVEAWCGVDFSDPYSD
jgi:hypothetical protein